MILRRRSAALSGRLGIATFVLLAATGMTENSRPPLLAYPVVPPSFMLTVPGGPRLDYPGLPADDRLSYANAGAQPPLPPGSGAGALFASPAYRPQPAIWKIADDDSVIYLFGTLHSLPPGFAWRSSLFEQIARKSQLLMLESVDDATDRAVPAAPRHTDRRRPVLALRLPPNRRAALARLLANEPPDAVAFLDQSPTWVAAITLQGLKERASGGAQGPGADDWLEAAFRRDGKRITGIERSTAVATKLDAIPEARQRRLLEAALDAPEYPSADPLAAAHAWAKGDVGPGSLLASVVKNDLPSPLSAPLIDERNRAWAKTLARRLRTPGTTLFAAGIGHFIGRGSLLDRLRARGLLVSRVQ